MGLLGSSSPGLLGTGCGHQSGVSEVLSVSFSKVQRSLEAVPCPTIPTTHPNLRNQGWPSVSDSTVAVCGVATCLVLGMGTERPHQFIPTAMQFLEMFSTGLTYDPIAHLSSFAFKPGLLQYSPRWAPLVPG